MYANASASFGFPHSSYSATVRGREASSIGFLTSPNGTCDSTTRNRSGRSLTTAPISNPPALPPSIATLSFAPYPFATNCSVTAMQYENGCSFTSICPASCHESPISPPPRICAYAITTPRSSSDNRDALNPIGKGYPYDPYP